MEAMAHRWFTVIYCKIADFPKQKVELPDGREIYNPKIMVI